MRVYCSDTIRATLGYQPVYLMLDRAERDGESWRGVKCVAANEPYFTGHFPQEPVLPGVLQLEAIQQLGLLACRHGGQSGLPVLTGVRRVKFRRRVVPGDVLTVDVQCRVDDNGATVFEGCTRIGDDVTCEAVLTVRYGSADAVLPMPDTVVVPEQSLDDGIEIVDALRIQDTLPHRYPMMLVDRVLLSTGTDSDVAIALKNVSSADHRALASCDGRTFMPSVFMLEIIAQAACLCGLLRRAETDKLAYFMAVDTASFYRPALPGDQLRIDVELLAVKERHGRGRGTAFVGSEKIAEAELKFAMTNR